MPRFGIVLDIPQPCKEAWADMTPAAGGRHCAACAKTVIDFSGYTGAALISFFGSKRNAGICCRLRDDQMKRELQAAPVPPRWKIQWYRAAALLLSAQALTSQAFAQKAKRPHHTVASPARHNTQKILKGQVTPFSGDKVTSPLTFLLHLGDTDSIQVVTDSNGYFNCPVPRAFREGIISWEEQEVGDGYIIPDAVAISPASIPDMLRVFRAQVTIMPRVVVEAPGSRVYGGLPAISVSAASAKRPFLKRVTAWLRKKRST